VHFARTCCIHHGMCARHTLLLTGMTEHHSLLKGRMIQCLWASHAIGAGAAAHGRERRRSSPRGWHASGQQVALHVHSSCQLTMQTTDTSASSSGVLRPMQPESSTRCLSAGMDNVLKQAWFLDMSTCWVTDDAHLQGQRLQRRPVPCARPEGRQRAAQLIARQRQGTAQYVARN